MYDKRLVFLSFFFFNSQFNINMVCNILKYGRESEKENDNLYGYTVNEPINPKSNANIISNAHTANHSPVL